MRERDERYARAQAIAHEVLELPDDQIAARLDVLCEGDTELRAEAEWLIAAVIHTSSDRIPRAVAKASAELADALHIDATAADHYHLLERLGEGGMGVVWLAEREIGGVVQRVALKRLHPGSITHYARFQEEQRILATLSHPNIAHLLDAGTGDDGEPYLSMEYVKGMRIDHWCDRHALDLRARIALFIKVCAAVSYAHERLVIHRDLKPANILVDAGGEPKLLDFGIARLLGADSAVTVATRLMTPAYASPEQIEGAPLGTAADVYSLGVILYELIAGMRPFDHLDSEHARSNAIVSGNITPPSRRTRQPTHGDRTPAPTSFARPRGMRIPADVDAIVLKALRREPDQRYASVSDFSEDLRRFLADRPVHARRGQWGYRARRFLWRNRWPLIAAGLLVATAAGFTWRTVLAEREARVQAETSNEVAEFLVSVFAASDSNVSGAARHDLTARAVLDEGAARIDKELSHRPPIRARLLEAVAEAYRHMNDNNKAAVLMREAVDLNLSPAVDQPLAAARCLEALANLLANGEFSAADAEQAAHQSMALAQRLTPADSQEIANAWMVLSLAQNRAGNYAAAQASAEKTLAMNITAYAKSVNRRLASAYNNLCIILTNRGDLAAARGACERTFEIYAAENEPRSMGRAMTTSRYGQVLARQLEPQASGIATNHAIELSRAIQGDHGRFTTLFQLRKAIILDDEGRYDEAGTLLQAVLAAQEQLDGKDSGEYANVLLEIGRRHNLLGEYDKALPLLRQVADSAQARYGPDDPRTLYATTLLALAAMGNGSADAATHAALDAADAAWARKDDPGPYFPPATWFALAKWWAMNGEPAQAIGQLDRIDTLGAKTEVALRARAIALRAQLAHDDAEAALRDLDRAWSLLRDSLGPAHPQTAWQAIAYARALRDADRAEEAATIEAGAKPVFERAYPADSAFRRETATP